VDLRAYARTLWRFRLLILAGLVAAAALALLSVARVSFTGGSPKLTYRKPSIWQARTALLMTQNGFPWGRAIQGFLPGNPQTGAPAVPVGDTSRLSDLSSLYVQLANGDAVQRLMFATGRVRGAMNAAPVYSFAVPGSGLNASLLPMINIVGTATSPQDAIETADLGTRAFLTYLGRQQQAARIPPNDRVVMQILNRPAGAQMVSGHRRTLPVVIFVSVMSIFVALAFVLENLRPRPRAVERSGLETPVDARQSA
jgi:hypothetical protein